MLAPIFVLSAALLSVACGDREPALCSEATTPIATIQGAGARSASVDRRVVVAGVVTAHFDVAEAAERGFFLQDLADDGNAATSEALFVPAAVLPPVGTRATVRGTVAELGTEARSVTALVDAEAAACGRVPLPAPTPLRLPGDLEAVENMLVRLADPLTVVDATDLGRSGELRVAVGGLLFAPTERAAPGPAASERRATNESRSLLLDDGSARLFPRRLPFLPDEVSVKTLPRTGDRIASVVGVLDRRGTDRVHVVEPVTQASQVREPRYTPPAGALSVAPLNLGGYFNGDGLGGGFPTSGGAASPRELERQEAKLTATVLGLGLPDVLSLQELENDGFDEQSAIARLTDALNARLRAPRSRYAYVAPPGGGRLGEQATRVALLYRTDKLRPIGTPAVLTAPPFAAGHRPPLAQTFASERTGERLTVVAVHLASRRCEGATGPQADQGDGQGCFNAARTTAARALPAWLATFPTGSDDPDWLLIGNLEAYRLEDPLTVLREAGLVDLLREVAPDERYTVVDRGVAGTRDHAFATPGLAARHAGTRIWHINAPFSAWLDYRLEGKPDELDHALYKASAVRASDRDPFVVSFGQP